MLQIKNISYYIFIISMLGFYNFGISQNITKFFEMPDKSKNRFKAAYMNYEGNKMVYITQKKYISKVYETEKNVLGEWSKPVPVDVINDFISEDWYIESPAYNNDATEIYFSLQYGHKDSSANIYFIKKISGNWTNPEKLPSPVNTKYGFETDPCISADGKTMYFAGIIKDEKRGKFECGKIYVSEKIDGKWTNPVYLPRPVNSGCERMPRIAADGKTLYMSSIRKKGKGRADIYYTKLISKNIWLSPIPIDTMNTENEELYPSISFRGKELIFLKKTNKIRKQKDAIYKHKLLNQFKPENTVIMQFSSSDLQTNENIDIKVDIFDPSGSIVTDRYSNNKSEKKCNIILQQGRNYKFDVYNENYSHYFFDYDASKILKCEIIDKHISLYSKINLILNVYDSEIYEPFAAKIKIYDAVTNNPVNIEAVEQDAGRYLLSLPIGKRYKIEAEKRHFHSNSFELDLSGVVRFDEFERDIELTVKKIFFEFGLADAETGEGVETELEITNLSTNEKIIIKTKTDKNGKLKVQLRDGERYQVNVTPKGYAFYNTIVDLTDEETVGNNSIDIELEPLKEEKKFELEDIIFEFNSADLNESSYTELNKVLELLIINKHIKMEISAHTDDVGSEKYNLKLSGKRAESVVNYFTENGISKEQLISKGYGKSQPAYLPEDTEENREKNRRVELKVLEINE